MGLSSFRHFYRVIAATILALAFASTGMASTEKILHNFVPLPDGMHPTYQLIADSAGNLYGVTSAGGLHDVGVVLELTRNPSGTWLQKVLHNFSGDPGLPAPDGGSPQGRLVFDSAGNLYGTTLYGGSYGCGTVYKLTPSSGGQWSESVIYAFCANPTDAAYPYAGLTFDGAGNLYGTTLAGGATYNGTVFELSPTVSGGWSEQVLYSFGINSGGDLPLYEVTLDAAGDIFGTTTAEGDENCNYYGLTPRGCGTAFELTASGGVWTENVLYTFTGTNDEYEYLGPTGRLLMDSAGNVYGSSTNGVYELQSTGQGQWTYTLLQSLGLSYYGDLAFDGAGNLYGEYPGVTQCYCGAVFELQNSGSGWNLTTLYSFTSTSTGTYPRGGVTFDASGNIFGVTYYSSSSHDIGTVFELTPASGGVWQQSFIYQFPEVDGNNPVGDLIADAAGNLYGVTQNGGKNCAYCSWYGIIFRLSPLANGGWQYEVLYDFSVSTTGIVGPNAGLVADASGNLYGTTRFGGRFGNGSVFELTPSATGSWQIKTLYAFGGSKTDGWNPLSNLIFDRGGNLYGTTQNGKSGHGTVFELSPQPDGTWKESQLYIFTGGSDGESPYAGLVFDELGNLYGTTVLGGNLRPCYPYTCGVVFKLSPNGNGTWTESVIHSFAGTDGAWPYANLIFDSAGNLYGTTSAGGPGNNGVVFELKPSGSGWTESVLYGFHGGRTDGSQPSSDVRFDSAGNLYGTTFYGGLLDCGNYLTIYTCGTLYKLTPSSSGDWSESIVHFFGSNANDGIQPASGVLIDSNGNLFGMTTGGPGNNQGGTVFEIMP